MSYAQWRNSYTRFFFVHIGIILILILGVYSGLSARIRTVHFVLSLLSSRFTANALVWFSDFLN
jgi:hypothetical protein